MTPSCLPSDGASTKTRANQVVEIDADELGPSLKWATARPQRVGKDGDTGGQPSGQFNDEPPF
jgi:hypothetical protein